MLVVSKRHTFFTTLPGSGFTCNCTTTRSIASCLCMLRATCAISSSWYALRARARVCAVLQAASCSVVTSRRALIRAFWSLIEVTMIAWSVWTIPLIVWSDFDPGRKCFHRRCVSDYPLNSLLHSPDIYRSIYQSPQETSPGLPVVNTCLDPGVLIITGLQWSVLHGLHKVCGDLHWFWSAMVSTSTNIKTKK